MRLTNQLLASVTILAATTLAGAVMAQGYDARYGGGPPGSTPDEMQQTDQLNQQGVNGTYQSPSTLNGQQGQSQQTQYSGPPSRYQSQQQNYQDQMQNYRDQQQHYRYDRARYEQNLRDYDIAQYAWSYPAPLAYHYGEGYGLQPLYLMAEPSQQLWQAPVEGPGGRWVGRVRNVQIGVDGRPFRIEVALNRRVSVWVSPGDLRFDPADGILYTDLTRSDLWTMPGATITSGPM